MGLITTGTKVLDLQAVLRCFDRRGINRCHKHDHSLESVHAQRPATVFHEAFQGVQRRIGKIKDEVPAIPEKVWTIEEALPRLQRLIVSLTDDSAWNFCHSLILEASDRCQSMQDTEESAIVELLQGKIGKVIFLVEQGYGITWETSALSDLERLSNAVEAQFINAILDYVQKLYDRCRMTESFLATGESKEQVFKAAMAIAQPKAIASILLTKGGNLNLGLVASIEQHFQGINEETLRLLRQIDPSWQDELDQIQPPVHEHTPSNRVIRSDFLISPTTSLTAIDCKKSALAALLTPFYQGVAGHCSAAVWAIKKRGESPLEALKDFRDLIREGKLTRWDHGIEEAFYFEKTLLDPFLDQEVILRSHGIVEGTLLCFWEFPALQAACLLMGIEDVRTIAPDVLMALFRTPSSLAGSPEKREPLLLKSLHRLLPHYDGERGSPPSSPKLKKITWRELIRACADSIAKQEAVEDGEIKARRGEYAFSQMENRLLRAWETALAGMSELRNHAGSVRNRVTQCVFAVLKPVFKTHPQRERIEEIFERTFNRSIRLVYNSASGGFELHDRLVKDLTGMGIKVSTPELFQELVLRVIDQIGIDLKGEPEPSGAFREAILSVLPSLRHTAKGPRFLKKVLRAYDPTHSNTPMISFARDNPWEVQSVDSGIEFIADVESIPLHDPYRLLQWVLEMGKGNQNDLLAGKSTAAWIRERLIDSGLSISHASVSSDTKNKLTRLMREWIVMKYQSGIADEVMNGLNTFFNQLNAKKHFNTQQYAQHMLDGLIKQLKLNHVQSYFVSMVLDGYLLQSLPEAQRGKLNQDAVRFAQSEDLYFYCYFNPRTQKVDFGRMKEGNRDLMPLDEDEWVDNQSWEIVPERQ
jgi:hypothetical protein